jgi:hypothetical protein
MSQDDMQAYLAIEAESGAELGRVDIAGDGRIAPQGEPPEKLARLVEEMNGLTVMHVDVPPEPDAPQYTLSSALIPRGKPGFVPALIDHVRTYYGVELRAI